MHRLEVICFMAALCAVNAAVTVNIYDDAEKIASMPSEECRPDTCNELCQLFGYSGGACRNGVCLCNAIIKDYNLDGIKDLGSCNYQACDQLCRRLGFPGGVCVGDRCKCDNFKKVDLLSSLRSPLLDENSQKINEAFEEVIGNKNECSNSACEINCQSLGLPGGYCHDGQCICDKKSKSEKIASMLSEECRPDTCNELCQLFGYSGGACRNGVCLCNAIIKDYNLDGIKDLGSCNYQACDQLCRRLGFPGGVCVGDRCKCDNFKKVDLLSSLRSALLDESSQKINEAFEEVIGNKNECSNSACEINCQSLGLPGGYCHDGQCICDKKKSHALRSCDVVACNEMCHRMNYIGGMCRQGSCHCY